MPAAYVTEPFSAEERRLLERHVTDVDGPVFALVDVPATTAAALFARYSRSRKSLRRLLLDEFADDLDAGAPAASRLGQRRASDLFSRVLAEYGDDSVAQLAGVHLACEQVSQPLAKAIEWGRLMAYLEQSTRYIAYDDRRDGRFRYHVDPELAASELGGLYRETMDALFTTYAEVLPLLRAHLDTTLPAESDEAARRRAIRALALDIARALLPAGTVSNLGVFGSPQAYEQLVMRLRAHPLPEARDYAERIAAQLRAVIPDFLTRLDRPDRGGVWVDYLRDTAARIAEVAERIAPADVTRSGDDEVRLVRFDPRGERRVAAAALYPHARCAAADLDAAVDALSDADAAAIIAVAAGERGNRRHRPGRSFEHTEYTFEVVSDYGAFRDLQRHRMLTMDWQELSCELGCATPPEVDACGAGAQWRGAVERSEQGWARVRERFPAQAAYLVTMGHRIRYRMRLNAREAMHLVELRSSPQGHPSYRRIALRMHEQIRDVAGHRAIAAAMRFVGSDDVHLPRYAAEAARRAPAGDAEAVVDTLLAR